MGERTVIVQNTHVQCEALNLSVSMHSLQEGKSGRPPEDNPDLMLSFK